jgi:hypothetical protein
MYITVAQLVKKFFMFYGIQRFFVYLYELPTGLYPESVESNQQTRELVNFQIHFNTILSSMPSFVMWFLSSSFAFNILYTFVTSPMCAVCLAHLLLLP